MRLLKFRVWHKPTNKYVTMSQEDWEYGKGPVKYKDSGDFLAISHDGFLCHEGYGNGAANVEDSENYVVQQYTGLKDKNGVEIYEGDLILSDHWASQETMVVKWDQDACMFYACLISGGDRINMDEAEKTVVGNIFEGVDK